MGDSYVHVQTALTGHIPLERSILYGFLVRVLAVPWQSFQPLILLQSLAGAATAVLLAWIMHDFLQVRRSWATLLAVLSVLDPLQLLHERMVLTEAFTQLAFVACMAALILYICRGSAWVLMAAIAVGTIIIALRSVYIPLLLTWPLLAVWVRYRDSAGTGMTQQRALIHASFALALTLVCHAAFRQTVAGLTGYGPRYVPEAPYFQLAAWAPVMEPDDAFDAPTADLIRRFQQGDHPLGLRSEREYHRWNWQGFVAKFESLHGTKPQGIVEARRIVWRLLWRHPLGILHVAVGSYADYFSDLWLRPERRRVESGIGAELFAPQIEILRERFNWDAAVGTSRLTPVRHYYHAAWPWYALLLASPFFMLLSLRVALPLLRSIVLFLFFGATVSIVSFCLFGQIPTMRYLAPLSPLVCVMCGIGTVAWSERKRLAKRG